MNHRKLRSIKIELYKKDCHCHWCGISTTLINISNGILPDNAATIDHVESVLISKVGKRNHHPSKLVLSCYKCNYDRGNNEVNNCSKKKWLALSTMPPRRRVKGKRVHGDKKRRSKIKRRILIK